MGLKYDRYSAATVRDKRWPALRLAAKRRDGWKCVGIVDGQICGAVGRLECDHIEPVRKRPDLAFVLDNLQSLCPGCHSRKTRIEVGLADIDPKRQAWRDFVRALAQPQTKEVLHATEC